MGCYNSKISPITDVQSPSHQVKNNGWYNDNTKAMRRSISSKRFISNSNPRRSKEFNQNVIHQRYTSTLNNMSIMGSYQKLYFQHYNAPI